MRELAKGDTIKTCQQNVDRMKVRGWNQLTEIKLDDSEMAYGNIRYVAVMEHPGERKKKRWNFKA